MLDERPDETSPSVTPPVPTPRPHPAEATTQPEAVSPLLWAARRRPGGLPAGSAVTQSLDPNLKHMWRIFDGSVSWLVGTGLAAGGCIIVYFKAPEMWFMPAWICAAVISLLLFIHALCWPMVSYRHRSYRVDNQGLEIRRGVFWKTSLYVPRSRVQHTDVNQGPIERYFGLSHLVIHTAGTSNASVTLEGLAKEIAVELRDHLVSAGSHGPETADAV